MSGAEALKAVELSLLIGVLSLDQVAVAQCMVSQPLVGGWILGWVCGDPASGLFVGAFYQFLCLTDLRVGGSVPPDGVLAGLIGTAVFLSLPPAAGWNAFALLGLLTVFHLPLALLARTLERTVCSANRLWVRIAEDMVGRGRFRLAQAAALGGIPLFFLRGFLLAAVVLFAASFWGGRGLPTTAGMNVPLELFARLVPLVGLAALVAQRRRAGWPVAVAAGLGAGIVFAGALALRAP